MRMLGGRRQWLGALCASLIALSVGAVPAQAAFDDPEFVFFPKEEEGGGQGTVVPPGTGFQDPCGLGVDTGGNFYVSDYYNNRVSLFKNTPEYLNSQITAIGTIDGGPCGLAIDTAGKVYVNDYHHSVISYTPSIFPPPVPPATPGTFGSKTVIDSEDPTGVAVNTFNNNVYVNNRTHVTVYSPAGAELFEVGAATLENGYGLGISRYLATNGYIYVADAATDTVKIYNIGVSTETPVASLTGPPGGFTDLRDSAIAVDRATGEIYVSDAIGSRSSENPEAAVYVFDPLNTYLGRLKYNVVDPQPVGLAVDNSTGANQGRVYVTSGISEFGSVYAYPKGSATAVEEPAAMSFSLGVVGSGAGVITSKAGKISCAQSCAKEVPAGSEFSLSATPDPGSTFVGWSGAGCGGSGACEVTMDEAASVSAEFASTVAPDTGEQGGPIQAPLAPAPSVRGPAPAATPTVAQRRKHRAKKRKQRQRRAAKQRRAAQKKANSR